MNPSASAVRLTWRHRVAQFAMVLPTSDGGDWYKPVIAGAAVSAAFALIGVWGDMQIVKSDMSEIKGRAVRQERDLADLQTRVAKLEANWSGYRQAMQMLGVEKK